MPHTFLGGTRYQGAAVRRWAEDQKSGFDTIGALSERDLLLLGIGLYWGEGSKRYTDLSIVNMDAEVLKTFIRWTALLGVSRERFKAQLVLDSAKDPEVEKTWWRDTLDLPDLQIGVTPRPKKTKRVRENYHGILTLKVRKSLRLLNRVRGMIEAVSEAA